MQQKLKIRNTIDDNGTPCGGFVNGVGIRIDWQDGPLGEAKQGIARKGIESLFREVCDGPGHNGAFVEGVILAAASRLSFYQSTRFKCAENAEALKHLDLALYALGRRTARRIAAGTEGTHKGN